MSRALDPTVKKALQNGDHTKTYEEISAVLTRSFEGPVEIELLGPSHDLGGASYDDGETLAIPKLRLIQAFIVARTRFQAYLARDSSQCYQTQRDILKMTAVMLLMDPEHLSAANARKRHLRQQLENKEHPSKVLTQERHFIDSLLSSRLHRHTKSPTLWSHRRWITEQLWKHDLNMDDEDDIRKIVMTSAEYHPRNYYAWCHARHLVKNMVVRSSEPRERLMRIIAATKKWCFSHHDDISGWQFLRFLLDKLPEETPSTIHETLELVKSFKWRNESVWYFLRYVVALLHREDDAREEVRTILTMLLEGTVEGGPERKTLETARRQIELLE